MLLFKHLLIPGLLCLRYNNYTHMQKLNQHAHIKLLITKYESYAGKNLTAIGTMHILRVYILFSFNIW